MTLSNRMPSDSPFRFSLPLAVGAALVGLALPIRADAQEPTARPEWSAPFAVQSVGRPLGHDLRRVVLVSEPPTVATPASTPKVEATAAAEEPNAVTRAAAKEPARPAPRPAPPRAATGTRTHRVEWGETWYGLAREYGITPRALSAANPDVDPEHLRSGEVIRIPRAAASAARRTHRVVPGETLWGISHRYGVTAAALRRANRLPDDKVRSGQLLIIPQEEKR
jgi:LysM repeat protein